MGALRYRNHNQCRLAPSLAVPGDLAAVTGGWGRRGWRCLLLSPPGAHSQENTRPGNQCRERFAFRMVYDASVWFLLNGTC